jgi:NNP family nitrate/nitrite transporter-like MFS transporter
VPILLFVAGLIFIFGQDHPSGRWEDRPNSNTIYLEKGHLDDVTFDINKNDLQNNDKGLESVRVNTYQDQERHVTLIDSTVDSAVKGSPTPVTYFRILTSPQTWLPPLAYMTSFGLELAIDSNMANVLFALFNPKRPDIGQTQAGYYTSIL